jgi:hypothetical protein
MFWANPGRNCRFVVELERFGLDEREVELSGKRFLIDGGTESWVGW